MAAALLLSLIFLASALLLFVSATRPNKSNLPPSPSKLPIIGNLHQLGSLPHRSLRSLAQKHGPLMLLHLFRTPTLVVSSPEMAHEIMKAHDLTFANRPLLHSAKQLFYNCRDILFSPYGEYWRQLRKICVLELLSSKRVKSFQQVREEEVGSMIDQVAQSCRTSSTVDMRHLLTSLTNGIVSRVALGKKYGDVDEKRREFLLGAGRAYGQFLSAFCVRDFFPCLGWVDVLSGLDGKLKKAFETMDRFLDQVIEEHQKNDSGEGDGERDLVDLLLQLEREGSDLGVQLGRDSTKAIILDMFIAATDTTAMTMEWAMAELVRNPKAMEKAQEEARRVVGGKAKVGVEDVHQMQYLKCIIKETLRLHPVAPLLAPRESSENVTLQGYSIPSKTRVLINAWAIAMDPKLWENPEEFLPERFDNNPIDFKGNDFRYIPFGAGRRICPGMSFANTSMEFALANLLYFFNWKLPDGRHAEDSDMSELGGLSVGLKFPLRLIPVRHVA